MVTGDPPCLHPVSVQSLVESFVDAGDAAAGGGLQPWQLQLLRDKLGLGSGAQSVAEAGASVERGCGQGEVGPGAEAERQQEQGDPPVRVYLAAPGPQQQAGQGGQARQPVDPRLLAAVRIATLQVRRGPRAAGSSVGYLRKRRLWPPKTLATARADRMTREPPGAVPQPSVRNMCTIRAHTMDAISARVVVCPCLARRLHTQ